MEAGKKLNVVLNIIFIILSAGGVIPILLVLAISFSSSASIAENGYKLLPSEFSLDAYRYIFRDSVTIFRAYGVTIFNAVVGTTISLCVMAHFAYAISRPDFKGRRIMTYYLLFTMLFSGGAVASYIVITTFYHLRDTIWVMIVPCLVNAWNIIILRTFFKTGVPEGIVDAGKIDGAGTYRILWQIVFPISLPGLATIALFQVLMYWNEWNLPLLYIVNPKLYNLQFLLQRTMQNIQKINETPEFAQQAAAKMGDIPSESARMALCFVAMGPILVVYPFFQKYFIQGLTVGSVKE